jgi:predicted MPP superfamily phosphohydrolase
VYVSRGLGTVTPPLRYNSRPELTLLTLTTG